MTVADKHYANKDKNKSKRRHGTVDIKNGDFILVNNLSKCALLELLVEAHFSINFFDKTNHLAISKSQLKQEQPVVVEVTQVFSPQLLEIEIQFFFFSFHWE